MLLNMQEAKRELATSDAAIALSLDTSDTQYTDLAGNQVNLAQYLGQVLIVISWASWSPASAEHLDIVATVASQYQDDEVVVVAINRAEPKETAEAYLQTVGVREQVKLVIDTSDAYYRRIGGYTMPETLVYDREGNIVTHNRGSLTASELTTHIEQALQGE